MLCERQIFAIRKRFYKSLLDRQIEFYEQNEMGNLTKKISSGIDRLRDGTTDKLVLLISASFSLLSGLSAAFWMSFDMGLVLLPLIIPVIFILLLSSHVSLFICNVYVII